MIDRKEIELVIRAQLQNKQALQNIPKVIKDIETGIDSQAAAAKRGESSIDELRASLLSLKDVQSTLTGTAGLVGSFQRLATVVEQSEKRVADTTKQYEDYRVKVGDVSKATDAQAMKLQRMAAMQDRAVATLQRQRKEYEQIGTSLKAAGVATDNLAESERAALAAAAQLGAVINKNEQAISAYATDVRKARDETKALNDATQLSAQRLDQFLRGKAADAATQARALEDLKNDIIKRSGEQARDLNLSKASNDALAASRNFTSLARASGNLSPKLVSVREAVNSILNPTDKAVKSIGSIEDTVKTLTASIEQIKGPVKDYDATIKSLQASQQALVRQSGLVDTFAKQIALLRSSRVEFQQARQQVTQYAQAVKQGGDEGAKFVKPLADAQARLKTVSEALGQQVVQTRNARNALREAGLATQDLAASQQRLTAAANGTVGAMTSLDGAVDRYGKSVERANRGGGIFGGTDGERTTLNFAQRLRGQILSLTAAYVGLFGAVNTAKGAIDAMIGQEAIESRLAVATESNDPQVIGKEFEYLRGRADYYGIGIKTLADSYGSYAIAAKSANFTTEQTKFTFEQLTAGMRVLKLNTDQQGRAFTQFQQILSKTKPEMEDIKTIAESGFAGIQGLMARGLRSIGVEGVRAGSEVADMFALMKKGSLDSGQAIYALSVQAQKELGGRIPQAIKTLQAEQGRFETATFEFQKAIAESGWADAYKNVLIELRDLMKSEDGMNAAKGLSEVFSGLAKVLLLVLNNLDLIKTVATTFILLWSGQQFAAAITGIMGMNVALGTMLTTLTAVQKGFLVFSAFIISWQIGSYLRDKFAVVRAAGTWVATGLAEAAAYIKHSYMAAFEALPAFFKDVMTEILVSSTRMIVKLAGLLGEFAEAAGLDKVASALNQIVAVGMQSIAQTTSRADAVISKRKAALQADLAEIRRIRGEMLNDDFNPPSNSPAAALIDPASGVTGAPGTPKKNLGADTAKAEAAAKKRIAEIEQITKALEVLTTRTEKAQGDSLASQLQAVDTQYAALSRKIKELGGKEGANFAKQFAEGIASLKGEITKKFNDKLLAEQEALTKKLEDVDAAAGRRNKTDLDARLKAVSDKYAQTYREIEDYRKQLEANGRSTESADAMKTRLDAGVQELKNLEQQRYYQDELTRREQAMQQLLTTRASAIKTINDLQEGNLITTEEARTRTAETMAQLQPQIALLAQDSITFAEALGTAFDPIKTQQFIANMQLGVTSVQRLNKELGITATQVNERLASGITSTFDTFMKATSEAVAGQKSWSEAIKETGRAFLQFAADFLREIALMILKRMVLKSLEGTGIGGFISAAVQHSGGIVGHTGNRSRAVSPSWFANAPRYHSGGMPGLAQDEYATILQKGEEVLDKNSPRNMMNGGLTGKSTPNINQRVILVDDRSRIPEAMASAEGDQVIIRALRNNAATVKSIVRS